MCINYFKSVYRRFFSEYRRAKLLKIVTEFEKDWPDYAWLEKTIKTQLGITFALPDRMLIEAPSALAFLFSINNTEYLDIDKKNYCFHYFFDHCDLNRHNHTRLNTLYVYFRDSRRHQIQISEEQMKKMLISCDFHGNNSVVNLFNYYVHFDSGYTRFNDSCQEIFLSKISSSYSLTTLAMDFLSPPLSSRFSVNLEQQKTTVDSFNFALPSVQLFFTKLLNEIKTINKMKASTLGHGDIINYLEGKFVSNQINGALNSPKRILANKI